MVAASENIPKIREDVLRDTRYPVHRIADKLLPYLQVLVEQFHPQQVILFGSYAYGTPDRDSDIDLLVVKPIQNSRIKDKVAIRRAWWTLLTGNAPLAFDLQLASPEEVKSAASQSHGYHREIILRGLKLT